MALSNWDTLAVDLNGEAQAGCFVSPGGVKVDIYKNWIYIHDAKAWRDKGAFVSDTIMEIVEGHVRYHDVHIRAIRGPQEGVYVACWHEDHQDKQTVITGMIGCGVSGYSGENWVGVTPESVTFLQQWISKKDRMFSDEQIAEILDGFVGDAKAEARKLCEEHSFEFPVEIARVQLSQGVRYNQGDGYFAAHIGTPLNATKPGESVKPILS